LPQATRGPKVVVSARATAAGNAVSWSGGGGGGGGGGGSGGGGGGGGGGGEGAKPLSFVCTLYSSKKAEAALKSLTLTPNP